MKDALGRAHGGIHSILARDHPHLFLDTTMAIWPGADFENRHRHGQNLLRVASSAWDARS